MSVNIEEIEVGDKIILSDRKKPLNVTKIIKPSDDPLSEHNMVTVSVKDGDTSYTEKSFGLEGPQGGEYTMMQFNEEGEAIISPAPFGAGISIIKTSGRKVKIEKIIN